MSSKISALTSATTPLAGTETLPIVQSGATTKVSVANLTAGRDVSTRVLTTTNATGSPNSLGASNFSWTVNITNSSATGIGATIDGAAYGGRKWGFADGYSINGVFEIVDLTAAASRFQIDSSGNISNVSGNFVPKTAAKGINFTANTPAAGMTSQLLNWYEEGTWTPIDASGASLSFTNAFGYYTRTGNVVTASGRVTYPTTASGLTALVGGLPFAAANNNQPGGGFIRLTNSGRSDTLSVGATTTSITFYSNLLVAATNVQYTGARVDFVCIYQV